MTDKFLVTRDLSTAYDGISKIRQRRTLQPLERDILCRVLSDVIREVHKHTSTDIMFDCGDHSIRLDVEEYPILLNIYNAINPRPDDQYEPRAI